MNSSETSVLVKGAFRILGILRTSILVRYFLCLFQNFNLKKKYSTLGHGNYFHLTKRNVLCLVCLSLVIRRKQKKTNMIKNKRPIDFEKM